VFGLLILALLIVAIEIEAIHAGLDGTALAAATATLGAIAGIMAGRLRRRK